MCDTFPVVLVDSWKCLRGQGPQFYLPLMALGPVVFFINRLWQGSELHFLDEALKN